MPEQKKDTAPALWEPSGAAVQKTTVVDDTAPVKTVSDIAPAADPSAAGQPAADSKPADPSPVDADKQAREAFEAKDRGLFERETKLRQQEKELQEYHQLKEAAKSGDPAVLTALGMDTMKLAEGMLTTEPSAPVTPEIAALQESINELKKQNEEMATRQQAQGELTHKMNQVRDLKAIARANQKDYAFLNMLNEERGDTFERIYDIAKEQFERDNIPPNFTTLMAKHEDEVMGGYINALQKLKDVPKFQEEMKKIMGQEANPATKSTFQAPAQQQSQTLTNDMNQTPPNETRFKPRSIKEAAEQCRKVKLWDQ